MSLRTSTSRTSLRLLSVKPKRSVKRKQFYDELYDNENSNSSTTNTPKKSKNESNSCSKNNNTHKPRTLANSNSTKKLESSSSYSSNSFSPAKTKPPQETFKKSKISKFRERINNLKSQRLSPVPDMDPAFFLRCHSDSNKSNDDGNLAWMCRFAPDSSTTGSNLMASCGGKIVCIIDYTSGKVMMRYKDINKDENFYAMAWTTLEILANKDHIKGQKTEQPEKKAYYTNILAVAGEAQEIKLLHPSQLVVYASMTGHRKAISSLLFHPKNPTWLFSGSEDHRIILWDIGVPDFTDYRTKHSQLLVLEAEEGILNMVYSKSLDWLLVGTEDGCFGWKMDGAKIIGKSRRASVQFQLPQLTSSEECVDGLVLLNDHLVACKYVEESYIYVWNLKEYLPSSQVGHSKTFAVSVHPLALLKYINIDEPYVYMSGTGNCLVVGDSHGRIFIYNVKSLSKKKDTGDQLYVPSRILDWPDVEYPNPGERDRDCNRDRPIINTVIMNEAETHVVATTDRNIICVWKNQDC